MKISQLKYFIATVQNGSINGAAQKLFISPQALSKRIQALEEELQTELFERRHGKIHLAPIGQLVYAEAVKLVEKFDAATERIGNIVQQDKGTVTLVCAEGGLGALKSNPVEMFTRQSGGNVEVLSMRDELAKDYIIKHGLNFGLTTSPMNDADYKSTLLCRWRHCVVVKNDHPLRSATSLKLSDLEGYTLQAKNKLYASYNTIKNYANAQGIKLDFDVLNADMIAFRNSVRSSDMVGIGVQFIKAGDYFTVIPLEDELYWELYLVTKHDAVFTYLPQNLIDIILKCRE